MSYDAQRTRIMLVGDEDNVHTVEALLDEEALDRCTVQLVSDPNEYLQRAAQERWDGALVLFDNEDRVDLNLLKTLRSATPEVFMMVLVGTCSEELRSTLLRLGMQRIFEREKLTPSQMVQAITKACLDVAQAVGAHLDYLDAALRVVAEHPAFLDLTQHARPLHHPLCECMPQKFLELTKTYSNLLDLAMARARIGTRQLNGHSVSLQLRFLAHDLGTLNAGVWDVLDIHVHALASRNEQPAHHQCLEVLIEVLTNLAVFYKHALHTAV